MWLFDSSIDWKILGSLLYEFLEYNAWTLLQIFGDRSIVDKDVKGTKVEVFWGWWQFRLRGILVIIDVIFISYEITFGLDDGSDMGSSDEVFDGSNDIKVVGSFLYESLEYIGGTLLDLSYIVRYADYGVIRKVCIGFSSEVDSDVGGKL